MIGAGGALAMWVVPDRPAGKAYRNHYEYVELARPRRSPGLPSAHPERAGIFVRWRPGRQ